MKKKRGKCSGFSPASRLRLIKLLASVEWRRANGALFVTLTYPDRVRAFTRYRLKTDREKFFTYIERRLGREICGVWRTEWQDRKDGIHTGKHYPHLHLLVFGIRFIPDELVREVWRECIGNPPEVITRTEGMRNKRQCGHYLSKYVGKLPHYLVNAAYHHRGSWGRQWGHHRKGKMPLGETVCYDVNEGPLIAFLEAEARRRKLITDAPGQSFTLLGDRVDMLRQWIDKLTT